MADRDRGDTAVYTQEIVVFYRIAVYVSGDQREQHNNISRYHDQQQQ